MLVTALLIIIITSVFIIGLMAVKTIKQKSQDGAKGYNANDKHSKKNRAAIIKDAEKKLSHDPHNVNALTSLGELYYTEGNWEKSWNVYKTLFDISAAHVEINQLQAAIRKGISAYHLDKMEDAISALTFALKKDTTNWEAANYLGQAFYKNSIYDKSIFCLKRAHDLNPSLTSVYEPLGLSYFRAQKYKDSLSYLRKALDLQPDNKEVMFSIAVAMTECGMGDKALKIFMHLRPDPNFGAKSCLEAGRIHERQKNIELAIQDYEIGLKLQNVPEKDALQIKYKCANAFFAQKNITKGLGLLKQVQAVHSGYKDVDQLVARYSELNQNSNLQTYLLSGTSDFIALCRKFITVYYPKQTVKIEDVSVQSESIEILCDVDFEKMEDKELFRFYRTTTVIGDMNIRELHSKLRDLKCDKGFCVTMGKFSDSAHKFIDGRPIDFIEKDELIKILKKVSMFG